jgi:hypothetical protein
VNISRLQVAAALCELDKRHQALASMELIKQKFVFGACHADRALLTGLALQLPLPFRRFFPF